MSFFEDRMSIVRMNDKELYLFKNRDNEISLDYFNLKEGNRSVSICKDAYGEFDLIIDGKKINLVYQNTKNQLKFLQIDKLLVEEIDLEIKNLPKIYEVKMTISDKLKSIIYLSPKFSERGVFEIHHKILKNGKWIEFNLGEISTSKFLNPIKVLTDKNTIYLFFYHGNQICMKEFHLDLLEWKETIVLTDKTEKLYIDVIKHKQCIHLVYSEYVDGNLSIKYKKFEYKKDGLYEIIDKTISNEGNNTHPTLILSKDKIWIVWKDTLVLNSSFSLDGGDTFSSIYIWKKTKTCNYVRYSYKQMENNEELKLNNSFGTIYPNIRFLGFGKLEDVEEIALKKRRE